MKFSEETKLCDKNHKRAQEALAKEEKRIADHNREFKFQRMEDLIKHQLTQSDDDPTRKIEFTLPRCYIAQGNGTYNYQQDFYGTVSEPRIAQLSIEQIKKLVYETFDELGQLMAEMNSGSTLSVAIITMNQIITAHIGDSRIIICNDGKATALTWDHKPEAEKERIEAAGGVFTEAGVTDNGKITIPRIGGLLAVSRAFGNNYRIKGKLHTPSLNVQPLSKNDILIIGSDGLWDNVAPSEIAKVTKVGLRVAVDLARATAFKRGSVDNCTVLGAENLIPNSIFFVGDSHGADQQKKPIMEEMNTVKGKFLEILDEKIDRVLNLAAQAKSSAEIIAQLRKPASQESGGSTQEYGDDFNAISSAMQSFSTTANASTSTTATTRTSLYAFKYDGDDNQAAQLANNNGRKRRKTTDNDDGDDTEIDDYNDNEKNKDAIKSGGH